jgi:F0F1-type ATP synthase epsilon subunit
MFTNGDNDSELLAVQSGTIELKDNKMIILVDE